MTDRNTLVISLVSDLEYHLSFLSCSDDLEKAIQNKIDLTNLRGLVVKLDYLVERMNPNNNFTENYVAKAKKIIEIIGEIDKSYNNALVNIRDLIIAGDYQSAQDHIGSLLSRVFGRQPEVTTLDSVKLILEELMSVNSINLKDEDRAAIGGINEDIQDENYSGACEKAKKLWDNIMNRWIRMITFPVSERKSRGILPRFKPTIPKLPTTRAKQ